MIGNAEFQCSCVYYTSENTALIVSLTVGLGLPPIILVIIIVIYCRPKRKGALDKQEQVPEEYEMPVQQNSEEHNYDQIDSSEL